MSERWFRRGHSSGQVVRSRGGGSVQLIQPQAPVPVSPVVVSVTSLAPPSAVSLDCSLSG